MHKINILNLKKRVFSYIATAMFFISIITLILIYVNAKNLQEKKELLYMQQVNASMTHAVKYFLNDYTNRVQGIIKTTNIAQLLQTQNREAMLQLLKPKFQYLHHENPFITIMQVHLSNGKSFLRVHKPSIYGDNIAQKRAMLRKIHKDHKLISGYETGLYSIVYRIIAPIFNKEGKYIGALEIGINPNYIVDIIKKINGFCGVVFIKESQLKLYSQPNNMFVNGYKLQSKLNPELISICKKIQNYKTLKNDILLDVNGKQYFTHVITLKNFNQEDSVKIVFFQDITNMNSFLDNSTYKFYLFILSVFLILSYLIYRRISFYQDEVEKIYLQTQKEINFNQDYLQATFDVTPYIMITTDGESIDKANPSMLEFFNYDSLEEFQAEHDCICDYFVGENDCLVSEINGIHWLNYILENPNKLHKVCMYKEEKRHLFIVQAHFLHIDSKKRSIVVFNDVTEVEELNERLELAVNGTNDGLWDWNLENGTVYFSPRWKEMLGYKDEELPNAFETWESRVHPDDLKEAYRKIEICHANPDIEYNHTHRLRHKNGSWVWILDRGQTIFNKEGKAIRMVGFHTDITIQKELESKLLASQQQFQQFMTFMPAHILIKKDGKIVYANDSAKEFFQETDILGKTTQDLLPHALKEEIEIFEKKVYSHGMHEEIFELTNRNHQKKIYRKMAFIIDEKEIQKVGVVFIDITQEYQLNKEINKLLSAFERSDISVLMTDIEGTIEYVNPSWSKVTGYSHEELIGENPRIVKSGSVAPEIYEKMWKQLIDGKVWKSEIKNKAKDGTEFWEDTTIIPSFDKNNIVDGFISFKLLINEKIKLQKDLHNQEEIMIVQSRHAAMGEMISMIAHQWRQPLSVIAMDANNILVDVELDNIESDSLKNDLSDILEQTKNLSQTIDDFRNFFKPNKIKDEVLVQDIYMESYRVIDKSLSNNGIEIEHDFHSDTKIKIFSRELLQVFINILKNAKEALQEKNTEDKKIVTNIRETDTSIIVEISDNAGGVKKNIIDKIFDPYFSTKNEKNGTGLGLYMSKIIIEKHLFGKLSVTNRDDGSCFTIELPKVGEGDD